MSWYGVIRLTLERMIFFAVTCLILTVATVCTGCVDVGKVTDTSPAIPPATPLPVITPPPSPAGAIRVLDMNVHRKVIPSRPGEQFRVRLWEDPSTGYNWTIMADPGLIPGGDRAEPQVAGAVPPWTGGFHDWDLTAMGPGPQTFTAQYARPGAPGVPAAATFSVTFLVAGIDGRVFSEQDYEATVPMRTGDPFAVILHENPVTGYAWEIGMSSGLTITAERSFPEPAIAPAGSGGMHEWDVKITGSGNQTVYGIYKRPGEVSTGTEDTFLLTIIAR